MQNEPSKLKRKKTKQTFSPGRRNFWRSFAGSILTICNQLKGITYRTLSDIDLTPDEMMREMVPVWFDGCQPEIQEDGIYLDNTTGSINKEIVYPFQNTNEHLIVKQFACGRNISVIADNLTRKSAVSKPEAYSATRNLFVQLCRCGLCRPAAAHLEDKGEVNYE